MKIGILTFHASHNFGSMLQNYALQQFLIDEGHAVETINLRNAKQKYMYHHPMHMGRRNPSLKYLLARFLDPVWLINECRRWHIFENFLKDNLILTKEYDDWNAIRDDIPENDYDAVIAGGDQIWNPFCYDFDWSYFLPDSIAPVKKVAFSPSMGSSIPRIREDGNLVSKIKAALEDFDHISVREIDACDYLRELLDMDIPVVADPTLLPDLSSYLKLVGEPLVKEPYIYYYTPSHAPDPEAEGMAVRLADELGLRIVTSYPRFLRRTPMKSVVSGPVEFLNLVKNAQIVVGKSYHLVIFSMLFHKEFITLKRKDDPRVGTLLERMKISGRNMETVDDYSKLTEIDFKTVDLELSRFRQETISYLRNVLDICRSGNESPEQAR